MYTHYGDVHKATSSIFNCDSEDLPFIDGRKVTGFPRLKDGDLIMVDAAEDYVGTGKSIEITNVGNQEIVAGLHTLLLRGISNSWQMDSRHIYNSFRL